MSIFGRFTAIAFIVGLASAVANGHEEPIGDVFPLVKVENGNFAIYFHNNAHGGDAAEYDMSGNGSVYRTVYSPVGELLGPRVLTRKFSADEISEATSMVYDKKVPLKDETVLFEADYLKGRPSYFVKKNGIKTHRRLAWPDEIKIDYVANVHVDETQLVMSATTEDHVLHLFHFDRNGFKPPSIATIGTTTFIYDFPGASNLVSAVDRFWIAWVHYRSEKKKFEMILSSWKPGEEKPQETVLDSPADWNTEITMAAIDDHLCIAYHCSTTGEYPGYSQIITIFREAKQ